MCNIAIKVVRQVKGKKSFQISSTKNPSTHVEIKTSGTQAKALDKVRILRVSCLRSWNGRNVSSVMVMSIFKSIAPIKPVTIREVEKIQVTEEEPHDEEVACSHFGQFACW